MRRVRLLLLATWSLQPLVVRDVLLASLRIVSHGGSGENRSVAIREPPERGSGGMDVLHLSRGLRRRTVATMVGV
jgi:hypothetical protein